jgi:hypothetical protein
MEFISENVKFIQGLAPDADALASTVTTDVVNAGLCERVCFVVSRGTGTTGTQTLTVEASATAAGSSTTAIAFRYRRMSSGDTLGAFTDATSAGFTTAAGGADIYLIEVQSADLPEAKPYVHLKSVEVVDAAVDAGILIIMDGMRYTATSAPTVIT